FHLSLTGDDALQARFHRTLDEILPGFTVLHELMEERRRQRTAVIALVLENDLGEGHRRQIFAGGGVHDRDLLAVPDHLLALVEEGADVAINYVSSEAAAVDVAQNITKMGRRAILARADVSDYPDTFRMAQDVLAEFGHLDILVNNAGVNSDKTFVKMDHASWRKVLAINLDVAFK